MKTLKMPMGNQKRKSNDRQYNGQIKINLPNTFQNPTIRATRTQPKTSSALEEKAFSVPLVAPAVLL